MLAKVIKTILLTCPILALFMADSIYAHAGWTKTFNAPAPVYHGGALVVGTYYDDDEEIEDDCAYLFAVKGNNTKSFWGYYLDEDVWNENLNTPSETVGKGAALTYAERIGVIQGETTYFHDVYLLVGRNTKLFMRFSSWEPPDPETDNESWTYTLQSIPQNDSSGGALTSYKDSLIFAFVGGDTNLFFKYNIAYDTWERETDALGSVGYGGALVTVGDYIYALQGGYERGFWKYNTINKYWYTLPSTPEPVGPGGALAYDSLNNRIFAFRGDITNEFWEYRITEDTWWIRTGPLDSFSPPQPIPVGAGGALAWDYEDDLLYAFLGNNSNNFYYYEPVENDAKLDAILSPLPPGDSMPKDTTVIPEVRVINLGNDIDTFVVFFKFIKNGSTVAYQDSESITLNSNESLKVTFDSLQIDMGYYTRLAFVSNVYDTNPHNDTIILDSLWVYYNDVGVESIISPPSIVDSGSTIIPIVKVKNYGNQDQTFSVKFSIDTFYYTREDTLGGGESREDSFPSWQADRIGNFMVSCTTELESDTNVSNDFREKTFFVGYHDIGVDSIISPLGTVQPSDSFPPIVKYVNYGNFIESLLVRVEIRQDGILRYVDDEPVICPPGDTIISFEMCPGLDTGEYTIIAKALLLGDQDHRNDSLSKVFWARYIDVGVVDITSPPDTVDSIMNIEPIATIKNYTRTLPRVNCNTSFLIYRKPNTSDTFYYADTTDSLLPGIMKEIKFPICTLPRDSFGLICSVYADADAHPENDTLKHSVFVRVVDIGTELIIAPIDTMLPDLIPPKISIKNYGNVAISDTSRFIFDISRSPLMDSIIYVDTVDTAIANFLPDSIAEIEFNPWRPDTFGYYFSSAISVYQHDQNPYNDSLKDSVLIEKRDVGVTEIILEGTYDLGDTVKPSAVVKNFGNAIIRDTFDAIFRIDSVYSDTQRIVNLYPDDDTNLVFEPWLANIGDTHQAICTTLVYRDTVQGNNLRYSSFLVKVHDVGTARISSPPSLLRKQEDSIIPKAWVKNLGYYKEGAFNVLLRISPGSYTDTTNTTDSLSPGDSVEVIFDPWTPNNANEYTARCTTLLNSDVLHDNDTVSATFEVRQFPTYSEDATGFNENQHLVRKPNSDSLHLVFQSNDTLFYACYSSSNWSIAETIGIGKLPCISLDLNGRPWVAYLSRDNESLFCAVRRNNNTWKRMFIFGAGVCGSNEPEFIEQPSMMHNVYPSQPPMAYLVCAFNGSTTGYSYIQFIPFDTTRVFYPSPLDAGLLQDSLHNSSISITPSDQLHVVWQRKRENTTSVYYRTTLEKVTPTRIYQTNGNLSWSNKFLVSYVTGYTTEPATKPFVEAFGDKVFVAWRGPNEDGEDIGEIWRRWKKLNNPWVDPENQSRSVPQESDYPVLSTGNVTAWQESLSANNSEIYAKVNSEIINISNTNSSNSKYPHVITRLHYPQYPDLTIDAIWTEESIPAYEVMYRHIELPCTSGGTYYSVNPGESIPSPYLEERDGYLQYEGYKIDYGRNRLIYNLPYLHPGFNYMARAIVFSSRQGRTKQNFELDDSSSKEIEFDPFQPETLWVRIPEETYEDDLEVRDRINRLIGNYAVLADLVIYQYEEYMGGGGEGGAMGDNISLSLKPVLYNCLPNPFGSQTVIRYQIPSLAIVSLKVYDITGREVRTLVNTSQNAGDYRIIWDGKDNERKLLGNGIYFYSLKASDFTAIKKLVLIK